MKPNPKALSRRERQIMDIVYQRGSVGASDVREALPDPPSYSAVRALLRVLEDKGHLRHDTEGTRYVYRPTRSRGQASRAALRHVVQTFFEGSAVKAAAALLDADAGQLDDEQIDALEALLAKAREEGR
ncbi:MAG: BlaI/MecI/CopY family transcriptional regulator [Nannocystaceae bacterium]